MSEKSYNSILLNPEELVCLEKCGSPLSLSRHIAVSITPINPLSDLEEMVYTGELGIQKVRLRLMPITGLTRGERRQSIERIMSKLRRWRNYKHRNIIDISGFCAKPDVPRLMLVSASTSPTILEYMSHNPGFDPLRSCVDIATGLDYLHRNSIVHGAVRGSNVLVNDEGQCILGEFAAESIPTPPILERYANWIAPELVEIHKFHKFLIDNYRSHDYFGEYQMASDIYALGCTALEIYMNEPPAVMHIPYDTVRTHKELAALQRNPTAEEKQVIPDRILGAISAMLSFVPHRRPQSEHALKWMKHPDMLRISACPPVYAKSMLWRAYRKKDV